MNIFVAKLNFDTQEETLQDAFEEFGSVDSVKVITDKVTGRSKGYAFVEMPNDDEALAAINELNESTLDGRTIVVKKAEPRENRDSRGGSGGGGGDRNNRFDRGGRRDDHRGGGGGYGGGGNSGGYGGGGGGGNRNRY